MPAPTSGGSTPARSARPPAATRRRSAPSPGRRPRHPTGRFSPPRSPRVVTSPSAVPWTTCRSTTSSTTSSPTAWSCGSHPSPDRGRRGQWGAPPAQGGPRQAQIRLRSGAVDVPAAEDGALVLDQRVQLQGYVERGAVGDPDVRAADHAGDDGVVELVGHPLVEQVAQQMRASLAELVPEAAQDQLVLQPGE